MTAERHGNGFTDNAEYVVRATHSGHAVVRGDGSYAEFLGEDDARVAARLLADGDATDRDYEWVDA